MKISAKKVLAVILCVCLLASFAATAQAAGKLLSPSVTFSYNGQGTMRINASDSNPAGAVSVYTGTLYKVENGVEIKVADLMMNPNSYLNQYPVSVGESYTVSLTAIAKTGSGYTDSSTVVTDVYTITSSGLSIENQVLKAPEYNEDYSQAIQASSAGGNVYYRILAGSLPAGLTMSDRGIISGVPNVYSDTASDSVLTIGVSYTRDAAAYAASAFVTVPAVVKNDGAELTLTESQTILLFGSSIDLSALYSCNIAGMKASYSIKLVDGTKSDYTYIDRATGIMYAKPGSSKCTLDVTVTLSRTGYESVSETICVFVCEKAEASLAAAIDGWTYGDTPSAPSYRLLYVNDTGSYTVLYKVKGAADSTYTGSVPNNAGDYTMLVSFEGAVYRAEKAVDFTIARKDISGAAVELSKSEFIYTGYARTVTPTVTLSGWTGAIDYDVSGNVKTGAGEYTCRVTGKGNYSGYAEAAWKISAAQQTVSLKNGWTRCVQAGEEIRISDVLETSGGALDVSLKSGADYGQLNEGKLLGKTVTDGLWGVVTLSWTASGVDIDKDGTDDYAETSGTFDFLVYNGSIACGDVSRTDIDTQAQTVTLGITGTQQGSRAVVACYKNGQMIAGGVAALSAGQASCTIPVQGMSGADKLVIFIVDSNYMML